VETSLSLLERLAAQPAENDWRRLHDLYQPLLRGWIGRAGVSSSDADDLSQEVLLVVFREIAGFDRRRPGAFRSWLRTILVHRLRDFFRSARYRPTATGDSAFLEQLNQLESSESSLSKMWEREHDEYVAARLMRVVQGDVAARTWQAFQRHVIEGRPAAQVAHELNLSNDSVLAAKSRILRRLREELAGFVD